MVLVDERSHIQRILGLFLVGKHQRKSVEQRDGNLVQRGIERYRGNSQDALGSVGHGVCLHVGGKRRRVVAHPFVSQHDTLRTACRATCMHQVCQVVGGQSGLRQCRILLFEQLLGHVGCDNQFCTTVLQNQFHAVCRIFWVAGDVGSPCFLNTNHREYKAAGSRQQHGHTVTLAHSALSQCIGDTVGGMVKLAICESCIAGYESHAVGLFLGVMNNAFEEEFERSLARICHTYLF